MHKSNRNYAFVEILLVFQAAPQSLKRQNSVREFFFISSCSPIWPRKRPLISISFSFICPWLGPHHPPHQASNPPRRSCFSFVRSAGYKTPNKKQKKGKPGRCNNRRHHQKSLWAPQQKAGRAEKRPTAAKKRGRPGPPMSRCTAGTHSTICHLKQFFLFFQPPTCDVFTEAPHLQQEARWTNRMFRAKCVFLITVSSVGVCRCGWLQLQVTLLKGDSVTISITVSK